MIMAFQTIFIANWSVIDLDIAACFYYLVSHKLTHVVKCFFSWLTVLLRAKSRNMLVSYVFPYFRNNRSCGSNVSFLVSLLWWVSGNLLLHYEKVRKKYIFLVKYSWQLVRDNMPFPKSYLSTIKQQQYLKCSPNLWDIRYFVIKIKI